MLDLAHECKRLICFTHVSSCYVNSNQPGGSHILEELIDSGEDPEQLVQELTSMDPQRLEAETLAILDTRGFPNTYTFSKHLCEKVLAKRRKNLRLTIIRPSAIISTSRQPFPGWTDSIAAVGSVHYPMGMGIKKEFVMQKNFLLALVPCDVVSNAILVLTVVAAYVQKHKLSVYHCTSNKNAPSDIFTYF